jgi:preprotein translocase subunit SecA
MMRDINYVVRDGKVEIVDEYTGRIFSDRNWRDGLHQAVEAKEGVPITEEKRTLARISRQRYFQRYEMLCGMTGTVSGHQQEFLSCYRMPIVVIPVRNESQRNELPPRYFSSENAKIEAIITDVKKRNRNGQPVLVGTRTIEQSIRLSQRLSDERVQHEVLNGVQDASEATLVSTAGWHGRVTVATNMAGRGTDIKPNQAALESGGLHVIGLERNHSRRIDRQLLGRAGRQGDPGSGQFFISADDEIIHLYDPGLSVILSRLDRHQEGQPNRCFDQRIRKIQDLAERKSYQSRCHVMKEELWLDNIKKAVS